MSRLQYRRSSDTQAAPAVDWEEVDEELARVNPAFRWARRRRRGPGSGRRTPACAEQRCAPLWRPRGACWLLRTRTNGGALFRRDPRFDSLKHVLTVLGSENAEAEVEEVGRPARPAAGQQRDGRPSGPARRGATLLPRPSAGSPTAYKRRGRGALQP